MKIAIFLSGSYDLAATDFYRQQFERHKQEGGRVLVTDGALALFEHMALRPDLIVGDMDSVSEELLDKFQDCETLYFGTHKDATDGELALKEALRVGGREITLLGAVDTRFETDHMLGNIFLLKQVGDYGVENDLFVRAHITDPTQDIYYLESGMHSIFGQVGDRVSVIPVSTQIKVSYDGLKYAVMGEVMRFGQSRPLRNELVADKATIGLEGRAILVHHRQSGAGVAADEPLEPAATEPTPEPEAKGKRGLFGWMKRDKPVPAAKAQSEQAEATAKDPKAGA